MIAERCRSGSRCVAATSDGAAITTSPLCFRCVEDVQAKLDELPKILAVLPAWKGGLRGQTGEAKVHGGGDTPACPLRVDVVDLIDDIQLIQSYVGTLRIADLVNQDDGVEWCCAIRKAFGGADRIIGLSRHWSRRFSACPECSQRSLGSYSGEDIVRCSSCGYSMSLDEYAAGCLIQ